MTVEPGARCLEHESPAVDACSRCRRFLCTQCARGDADGRPICPSCRAAVVPGRLLGGWLLAPPLFLGLLIVRFLGTLSSAFSALRERSIEVVMEGEGGPWLVLSAAAVVTQGAVALVSLMAIRWALAHRRLALTGISAAVTLNALGAGLEQVLAHAFPAEPVAPLWPALVALAAACAWFAGLSLSTRPKATFTL